MYNSALILLLFLTQSATKKNKSVIDYSDISNSKPFKLENFQPIMDFLSSLRIDPVYTKEKIKIISKVGPYFPEKYIDLINQSMLHAERIIKVNELLESLNENNKSYIDEIIPVNSTKDRVNKIVKTVQNETSNTKNKEMGMVMDLVVNMDKYKKMFTALNTLMNSDNPMEHPDKLINMLLPILGEDEKNQDKIKEMTKMMEIVKALNISNKETENNKDTIKVAENS